MASEAQTIQGAFGTVGIDIADEYRKVTAALGTEKMTTAERAAVVDWQNKLGQMLGKGMTTMQVGNQPNTTQAPAANTTAQNILQQYFKGSNYGVVAQPGESTQNGSNQFGPSQTSFDLQSKIQGLFGNVGFAVLGIGLVIMAVAGPILYRKMK